ncbi:MAG: hypothetical protein OXK80_06890 [Bdellovibrionales bacterium]|nr:hypothetical protein [Bdellovibrionales bacterium]
MGVRVLSRIILIFLSLGFFGKKEKVDVPRIQRAVVTENQAIIYAQPDFDAEQVMRLPNNKIIAISTKIYRPKNLFGSFYRIFINKPRKIRGYISEIDVLPQYKKTKEGYVLNREYQKKEKALKQVKTQLIRKEDKKAVQADDVVVLEVQKAPVPHEMEGEEKSSDKNVEGKLESDPQKETKPVPEKKEEPAPVEKASPEKPGAEQKKSVENE